MSKLRRINIEGKDYWLNAWKNDPGVDGKKPSFKFTVKVKEPKQEVKQEFVADPLDDEIPF